MQIAVLGAGAVGRALAPRFAELGHAGVIGTRGPGPNGAKEEYAGRAAEHADLRLASLADARGSGIARSQSDQRRGLARGAGGAGDLAGTIVLDVSDGLDFSGGFPPRISAPQDDSIAEQVQRARSRAATA